MMSYGWLLLILLIIIPLVFVFLNQGVFWKYGTGTSTGVVYAVDDGILFDKVWFKPSAMSTESDCYLLFKDARIKEEFKRIPPESLVKIAYNKYLFTLASCPKNTKTNDIITGFEIINLTGVAK